MKTFSPSLVVEDILLVAWRCKYVHFKGARWDVDMNSIADSRLKELHPEMPVMSLRAITQDKQDRGNLYECPVYKTRERGKFLGTVKLTHFSINQITFLGPTYIWTFNLKTRDKPSKWVLAGVALLLQI